MTAIFDAISPVDETIVETVRFADRAEVDNLNRGVNAAVSSLLTD